MNTTTHADSIKNDTKVWENSWDAIVAGQPTRIRRILSPRGAYFEALRGDRWFRIDTMKAADAIAAAK